MWSRDWPSNFGIDKYCHISALNGFCDKGHMPMLWFKFYASNTRNFDRTPGIMPNQVDSSFICLGRREFWPWQFLLRQGTKAKALWLDTLFFFVGNWGIGPGFGCFWFYMKLGFLYWACSIGVCIPSRLCIPNPTLEFCSDLWLRTCLTQPNLGSKWKAK